MKKHGPWTIKSTKKVYENPWVTVTEDQVIRPDGKKGLHAVVEISEGSHVLPIDENGFCHLTKEFHYAVGKYGIENASGGINPGETALQAAKRELKEELGITAKKWVSLGAIDPLTTIVKTRQYLFLAQALSFGKAKPEGSETISQVKMHLNKLVEKCLNGEITYAPTIALAFRASEKLKNVF